MASGRLAAPDDNRHGERYLVGACGACRGAAVEIAKDRQKGLQRSSGTRDVDGSDDFNVQAGGGDCLLSGQALARAAQLGIGMDGEAVCVRLSVRVLPPAAGGALRRATHMTMGKWQGAVVACGTIGSHAWLGGEQAR